jgi:hypothetical protein
VVPGYALKGASRQNQPSKSEWIAIDDKLFVASASRRLDHRGKFECSADSVAIAWPSARRYNRCHRLLGKRVLACSSHPETAGSPRSEVRHPPA